MLKKAMFLIINTFFDLFILFGGSIGLMATSNWIYLGFTAGAMQDLGMWLICLGFLFLFFHWWLGAGRKLDKIFRDYLFEHPFLVGDNMPLSEFSSSTIIQLNHVRSLTYAMLLIPTSKKNKFVDSWADKYEYKSKITFMDRFWAFGFFITVIVGIGLFGISLL